jgi:hypothetical protein
MKQIKTIAFIFFTSIFLNSCGMSNAILLLDNTTDKPMNVEIGDEKYTINAKELKRIEGFTGKQKLIVDGKESEINIEKSAIVNVNDQTFVVSSQEFSMSGGGESQIKDNTIMVNGKTYKGPFEVRKGILINTEDLNWMLDDPIPEEIEVGNDSYKVMKKIWRAKDFVNSKLFKDYLIR